MEANETGSEKSKSPSLSLVLPAYNEEPVIAQAIAEADQALQDITSDYEILIVDDGSSDETASIVQQTSLQRPNVRLLKQPTNQGYGAALSRGFRESTKDLVAFTDADCQFDIRELRRLVMLSKEYDIVCGYRIDRQDPWVRKVYSGTYNAIVRGLLGTQVRDSDCAMKVFRRQVIQDIDIQSKGFFVNSEILTKARLANRSIVEVGVTHRPRPRGESTVSPLHAIPVAKSILRFWWNTIQFPATSNDDLPARAAWPKTYEFAALVLLLIACIVALMPNLTYPLIEPDETRYAQIALEMTASGDWITPRLDGVPYLDKPPLLYWLTAASVSLLGPTELAVRLPPVLSALATILVTFWLGRRLIGGRGAWCGAISLLLCGGFVLAGRFLLMDSLLTLCTTTCLLTGYLAVREPKQRPVWWLISGIACALGVLTKGPLALVLCAPPLVANGWLRRDQTRTRLPQWVAFALPIVVICLPWYVAVWKSNPAFGDYFFWEHNVKRFTTGSNHQQAWWFYLPVLFAGMFPASLLLPTLGVFLFSRDQTKRRLRSKDLGFLLCGSAWIIGFFSLASCKLPTYILPAMPLICLMLGSMIDHTVLKPELANRITTYLKPFPQRASLIVLACCLLVALADLLLSADLQLISMIAIGFCLSAAVSVLALWNRPVASSTWGWGATVALGLATISFTSAQFMSTLAAQRSIHVQSARLLSENPDRSVIYFGEKSYASSLYLPQQKVAQFDGDQVDQFARYLSQHPAAIVVTSDHTLQSTQAVAAAQWNLIPTGVSEHLYLVGPAERAETQIALSPETKR